MADPTQHDGLPGPAGPGADDAVAAHVDGVRRESREADAPGYRPAPDGHAVRRPTDDDLGAIAELYDRAALRAPDGSAGRGALRTGRDLRRTWHERRNDALVVEDDGRVVGYVEFHEQLDEWTPSIEAYAEGRVDPGHGAHGVGTFLLERVLDRATATARENAPLPVVLRTTLVDPTPRTLAWFAERSLVAERHLLQLRIDLTADLPAPVWPAGTHPRRADEVPVADLHGALVASFTDHHLGATDDLATWRELAVDRGRVQLWASVAAVDDHGEVIGIALGHVGDNDPGLGVIAELGVVPSHRGVGLATALLRGAFRRFAALGIQRVGLEVDDITLDGALRLYQRAGMEVVHHTVVLRTDLGV